MGQQTVREAALDILLKIEHDQGYSNILLNRSVEKYHFGPKDTALLTRLVYGTVQRKNTLDFDLQSFVKKQPEKWVRVLLLLALYQMAYLERVPERAVLHETVEIAKHRGHKGITGFVNGILRSVQRQGFPNPDKIQDPLHRMAIQTSHPNWLLERWRSQYDDETVRNLCEANNTLPLITARVNTLKTSKEDVLSLLQQEGMEAEPGNLVPEAVKINKGVLPHTKSFQDGLITIQDEGSMLAALALDVKDGMNVLDACAAPGGKTTHIAERMRNTGQVTALDIHEHKVKLIEEQAARLGLTNVSPLTLDSRNAVTRFQKASFDRILVDAPCSGFGVIRRKPDIKWGKTPEDIDALANVQTEILQSLAPLLRPGGKLVYSTCTIEREENEKVISLFLQENPDFSLDPTGRGRLPQALQSILHPQDTGVQLLPQYFGTDGFYLAALEKEETR